MEPSPDEIVAAIPKSKSRSLRISVIVPLLIACSLLPIAILALRKQDTPMMPLAYAYVPSPNIDDRPAGTTIDCIVLHATVEPTLEGTRKIFLDPVRKVSAHFVVGKEGEVLQMVPVEKRAWHAGKSLLEGKEHVNDFSVGVEIVNLNDGKQPFTDAQYEAVAGIVRFVRSKFPVPDQRIVSHAQIALPVGRKSDPLGLDFDRVRMLAKLSPVPEPVTVPGIPPSIKP